MTFQPGYAAYTQAFGTAPAGVSFPYYGAVAPTSTNVQGNFGVFQLGQQWIVPGVGAWVLIGLSSSGGTLSATWEQTATSTGEIFSLIADSGTAVPSSGAITISGGTTGLTTLVSPSPGSTMDLTGTLGVANGGTGAATLTGLLTGNGTSAVVGTAITEYNVLTGGVTNLPHSVAPSATSGVPFISQGSTTQPAFGTAVVAGGGTGDTSFTAYSVITGGTTSTGALQNVSGVGTSGQYLTSNGAGALPSWQTSTPQLVVTPVAGATQAMTSNHSYIANDSAQTVFTLPTSSLVGDIVQIVGSALNTGGWEITYTTNQIIWGPAGHSTATTGNATSASAAAQSVTMVCVVANTTWVITSNSGTITLT